MRGVSNSFELRLLRAWQTLILDLEESAKQTKFMAHIYLTFDFGKDEEKAQQARHKLESWKQAFRLDKKMLYKFDRKEADGAATPPPAEAPKKEKPAKAAAAKGTKGARGKSKANPEPAKLASSSHSQSSDIKLILRLALPNHEKLTEQRLLKRFPSEEPFKSAEGKTIREAEAGYAELDSHFQELV
jgi:hypothetical protein